MIKSVVGLNREVLLKEVLIKMGFTAQNDKNEVFSKYESMSKGEYTLIVRDLLKVAQGVTTLYDDDIISIAQLGDSIVGRYSFYDDIDGVVSTITLDIL